MSVSETEPLSHLYAQLRSHLFAYHYAQNYASIIRQGLGRCSSTVDGGLVSCPFTGKHTYGETTTTQTDRLLPGQYFLYLFGLDLQSRCLIYSPPPVPVTLQHRRLHTRRKGDGQPTNYTYSDVMYIPLYGHAPVMRVGSVRGQSVKYIHSKKLTLGYWVWTR